MPDTFLDGLRARGALGPGRISATQIDGLVPGRALFQLTAAVSVGAARGGPGAGAGTGTGTGTGAGTGTGTIVAEWRTVDGPPAPTLALCPADDADRPVLTAAVETADSQRVQVRDGAGQPVGMVTPVPLLRRWNKILFLDPAGVTLTTMKTSDGRYQLPAASASIELSARATGARLTPAATHVISVRAAVPWPLSALVVVAPLAVPLTRAGFRTPGAATSAGGDSLLGAVANILNTLPT